MDLTQALLAIAQRPLLSETGEMKNVVGKGPGIESWVDLRHVLRLLFVRCVTFTSYLTLFFKDFLK